MATALSEVAAKEEFDYEVVNANREQAREDIIKVMRKVVEEEGDVEDAERA